MPEADIYWHLRLCRWSIRVGGRVVDHLPCVTATRCRMVVRETERLRAIARGQRSVHAWIRGEIRVGVTVDNCAGLIEIGYSPWHAPTFTRRPDFTPIFAARMVVFMPNGQAFASP
jgi:hypothetical protein